MTFWERQGSSTKGKSIIIPNIKCWKFHFNSRCSFFRRSSAPKRLSHSFGASHFGNDKIVAKTIVTMGRNGKTQAESFVETHPVTMDIEELKKQRKRSSRFLFLFNPFNIQSNYAFDIAICFS